MPSVAQLVLGDLDHEIANTRRMLERFPDDRIDFAPHSKSSTVAKLASHVATIPRLGMRILEQPEFDILHPLPAIVNPPQSASELAAALDAAYAPLKAKLAEMSDAAMMETWTMRRGDHVLFALPRVVAMRSMVANHIIHHRAQLAVYYRLMDIPVPGMYGPSADER